MAVGEALVIRALNGGEVALGGSNPPTRGASILSLRISSQLGEISPILSASLFSFLCMYVCICGGVCTCICE